MRKWRRRRRPIMGSKDKTDIRLFIKNNGGMRQEFPHPARAGGVEVGEWQ